MIAPICAKCRGEMAIVVVRHRTGAITHNPVCSNGHEPTGRTLTEDRIVEPAAPTLKLVRSA